MSLSFQVHKMLFGVQRIIALAARPPLEASRTDTQLASHHELALHGIAFQQLVGLLDHFRGQPPENSYRRWWKRTADEMPRQLLQYFSVLSPGGAILGQRVGVGAH